MENTGAPNQKWNVRREWSPHPADRRELYYSGVDRRIHLKGAKEGWLEIGHFGGQSSIGEIRMLDSDYNGFFDRWEVYLGDQLTPVRVTTVRDEKVRPVAFDFGELSRFYTDEVLPAAMDANEKLINAMRGVHTFPAPEGLENTLKEGFANMRRYAQDVLRELHFQSLRRALLQSAHLTLLKSEFNDLFSQRQNPPNSETAWRLIRLLQDFEIAYGNGDFEKAVSILQHFPSERIAETVAR
jgi:hypothetical protein